MKNDFFKISYFVFCVFSVIVMPISLYGQSSTKSLFPIEIDGKWGFIDSTGYTVIKPQYKKVKEFSEGLALVLDDKHGSVWINCDNKIVINGIAVSFYYGGGDFAEGYAAIVLGDIFVSGRNFIDKSGKFLMPRDMYFYDIQGFSEGLAPIAFQESNWGFINRMGNIVIEPKFDYVGGFFCSRARITARDSDGETIYGFIDKTGRIIVAPKYRFAFDFSENLARVMDEFGSGNSFIDTTGTTVIPSIYRKASEGVQIYYKGRFSEGLARTVAYSRRPNRSVIAKHGFINTDGKIVIETMFDDARWFSEGLAPIEIDGEWGFIDKTGRIVIEPQFPAVRHFSKGVAKVSISNPNWEKFAYINKSGKYIWLQK